MIFLRFEDTYGMPTFFSSCRNVAINTECANKPIKLNEDLAVIIGRGIRGIFKLSAVEEGFISNEHVDTIINVFDLDNYMGHKEMLLLWDDIKDRVNTMEAMLKSKYNVSSIHYVPVEYCAETISLYCLYNFTQNPLHFKSYNTTLLHFLIAKIAVVGRHNRKELPDNKINLKDIKHYLSGINITKCLYNELSKNRGNSIVLNWLLINIDGLDLSSLEQYLLNVNDMFSKLPNIEKLTLDRVTYDIKDLQQFKEIIEAQIK